MSSYKPKIIVLSAPSGSGKDTIYTELKTLAPDSFEKTISYTTRECRDREVRDVSYIFTDVGTFNEIHEKGGMAEHAKFGENYYGTPAAGIEKITAGGKHAVLIIDVNGAVQIKRKYPESVLIMMLPPDKETLERRLRERSSETEDEILKRLAIAKSEVLSAEKYDYIVINYTGGQIRCAQDILDIVENPENAGKHKASNYSYFIENFFK